MKKENLARINSDAEEISLGIITKEELARELRVSTRTIENMCAQRIIPFIRATKRAIRFDRNRVRAALAKRETHEVAR